MSGHSNSSSGIAEMLAEARNLLADVYPVPPSQTARTAAALTRSVLEAYIEQQIEQQNASVPPQPPRSGRRMTERSKIVCFTTLARGEATASAAEAAWAWWALSVACHRHAYNIGPTHGEIGHLIDCVERVINR